MNLSAETAPQLYRACLLLILGLCPLVFGALLLLPASYGRHKREKPHWAWGPGIPTRLAWIIMEAPSSLGFAAIYFAGADAFELTPLLLFAMWQSHYFQRSFIFPFKLKTRPGDTTPIMIPVLAVSSNLVISFLNAAILSWPGLGRHYDLAWLADPRFILGALVFVAGYRINRKADAMLAALRKPGETGYKIPHGWLYEKVSCPNYLGEFLVWIGWAIATWSLGGLAFVLWTLANLMPRALQNHRWYHDKFPDYPRERRAVIPYLI
jgi:steroid 5-alpha-reductase/3-oxo-5-alpha-steroid 4-dehydrogenase 1